MDREIAFRVWNTKSKKYSEFDYAISEEGGLICLVDEPYEFLTNNQSKHLIVQQFTGLQDKNENDIYEGDIISFIDKSCLASNAKPDKFITKVVWDNNYGHWAFQELNCDNDYDGWYWYELTDVEIIGNIFEYNE